MKFNLQIKGGGGGGGLCCGEIGQLMGGLKI